MHYQALRLRRNLCSDRDRRWIRVRDHPRPRVDHLMLHDGLHNRVQPSLLLSRALIKWHFPLRLISLKNAHHIFDPVLIGNLAELLDFHFRLLLSVLQILLHRIDRLALEKLLPKLRELRQMLVVLRDGATPLKQTHKPRLKPLRVHRLRRFRVRFQYRIDNVCNHQSGVSLPKAFIEKLANILYYMFIPLFVVDRQMSNFMYLLLGSALCFFEGRDKVCLMFPTHNI